ncbi:MAG: hypothetical protein ABSA49_02850 [Rhizomicrobium sp.]|jgi:hypothetical protein
MSDSDQLAAIGQKLTAALTSAYGSANSNAALVFLPGGVTVPGDLVQSGIVNPAQMQTFLETNFDSPFVISPSESAVHGKDESYGTSSLIYMTAATSAQPLGSPADPAWKRVAAEIAMAQNNLTATNMQGGFVCEPDDWVLPSNTGYWTAFDSTQIQPAQPPPSTTAPPPKPVVNPRIWVVRPLQVAPRPVAKPPVTVTPLPRPMPAQQAPARSIAPSAMRATPVAAHPVSPATPPAGAAAPPANSTITLQLQHQCVTLGYMSGGATWWDGAFLADTGWYIPGMTRGALLPLPPPEASSTDLAYGLPVALIVVQGLTISGSWTNEAATALGSLGPFSLQGATAAPGNNGSMTYTRAGMQVIALLCSQLPILPPVNDPTAEQTAAATPAATTTAATAPPAGTAPPAATGTTSPSGGSANAPTPAAAPSAAPIAPQSTSSAVGAADPTTQASQSTT